MMIEDYLHSLREQRSQLDIHDSQFNDWLESPVTKAIIIDLKMAQIEIMNEICSTAHLVSNDTEAAALNASKGALEAVNNFLSDLQKVEDEES